MKVSPPILETTVFLPSSLSALELFSPLMPPSGSERKEIIPLKKQKSERHLKGPPLSKMNLNALLTLGPTHDKSYTPYTQFDASRSALHSYDNRGFMASILRPLLFRSFWFFIGFRSDRLISSLESSRELPVPAQNVWNSIITYVQVWSWD